jgi:SAM-dependent methyltransferase
MDISKLKAGDDHFMAYVGPPTQYDFMGSTQFRLLCTLGLRSNHFLLDFGCGSLRAGRLFICYLDKGKYFGIEPNKWLIDDAIDNQIGRDMVSIKVPQFDHNGDFKTDIFNMQFDFILAQSIFTHSGRDIIKKAFKNFKESLKPDGIIAVTFQEGRPDFGGNGWVYPDCVSYRVSTIKHFAEEAGLYVIRIPWFNPRVGWYLLAKNKRRLPGSGMLRHLSGAVLFDPEFKISWNRRKQIIMSIRNFEKQTIRRPIKNIYRKLINKKGSQH